MMEVSPYDMLAEEYYDERRHPTCANFRQASFVLLRRWLADVDVASSILEVGAGRSAIGEILRARDDLRRLTLLDSSARMLRHSSPMITMGAGAVVADARRMPFGDDRFDVVAAVLGDPFNETAFWLEAARVVRPQGIVLYTTPAFEWAEAYRPKDAFDVAVFELAYGAVLNTPSLIHPVDKQLEIAEMAGLLVKEVRAVPISALNGSAISPKLMPRRGDDSTVVTGYLAIKP
jgi:SAM-dependent methyltransferase